MAQSKFYIGTSGWVYQDWNERFYPQQLKVDKWLSYYSQRFSTVEINNTFYQLPLKKTVQQWYKQTPEDFCFAVKASRYITHMKKLNQGSGLNKFLGRVQGLKNKLGPVLFQLPCFWHKNEERLKKFLGELPGFLEAVFEFRHPSWYDPRIYELLRKQGAALCIHDKDGQPSPAQATANFTYVRFHGAEGRYARKYSDQQLKQWLKKLKPVIEKLDRVYCYFNNDTQGFAIQNAKEFQKIIKTKSHLR